MESVPISPANHTQAAIFALSRRGTELGRQVQSVLSSTGLSACLYSNFDGDIPLADVRHAFATAYQARQPVIGICATAIVIRCLADLIGDKQSDPPVLAISEDGRHVVPLLGGHHGANQLASQIAKACNGSAAITTATDSTGASAPDDPPEGWRVAKGADFKSVNAALAAGIAPRVKLSEPVQSLPDWISPHSLEPEDHSDPKSLPPKSPPIVPPIVTVSLKAGCGDARLHPRQITIGMGCERGASPQSAVNLIQACLEQESIAAEAVAAVGSLDIKGDEPALHAISEAVSSPIRLFTSGDLKGLSERIPNPSQEVCNTVGTPSVAEASALALAGPDGSLLLGKTAKDGVTCALALSPTPLAASNLAGRSLGSLAVVGLGPGRPDWRCPEATKALRDANLIVGFQGYLELAGEVIADKKQLSFGLGQEIDRVRAALDAAASGQHVALICSGDPGIYAMASLVFEEIDTATNPLWSRTPVRVCPGISALQAASAKVGAPLGHDFCAISLSDLLTPWEVISARLKAAAEGDFVIAFYNPVSKRRQTQLAEARTVLLAHRPSSTPVVIARNLGRPGESLFVTTLESLKVSDVDMLSLVLVGSSQTRIDRSEARGAVLPRIWTPRGYDKLKPEKT